MSKKYYKLLSDKLYKLHLELSKAHTWCDYIKIREDIKKIHENIGYDFTKLKTAYNQTAIDRLHKRICKDLSDAVDKDVSLCKCNYPNRGQKFCAGCGGRVMSVAEDNAFVLDVLSQSHEDAKISRESSIYEFGKNQYYFPNQIAVWGGKQPAILRIKNGKAKGDFINRDCYESTMESHNSLHYSNLRPATISEIKFLGEKEIHLFDKQIDDKLVCRLCDGKGRRVFPNCVPPIDEPCPVCNDINT